VAAVANASCHEDGAREAAARKDRYRSCPTYEFDRNLQMGQQTTNVSVFSAPAQYRVVKITCSRSEVVLRTMKHTIIYPNSCPSSEVIVIRLVV
jgi:hypothetical protein